MKKLASLSPGSIFNFAGEKFVILDKFGSEAFVILAECKERCPFNNKDGVEDPNNYIGSTFQERIDKWVSDLPRNRKEADAILPFKVDLSCTDQSDSYGVIEVRAAPLTLWQYGKYKELIPLNGDDWWWLVTPWRCRWLRSTDTGCVWYISPCGDFYGGSASGSGGIRPALLLNSEILVSSDEESCGECECRCGDKETLGLEGISTEALLNELKRRAEEANSVLLGEKGKDR